MLNTLKIDVFLVCHSLGQVVTFIDLLIFVLYLRYIAFHRKFYKYRTVVYAKYVKDWCVLSLSLTRSVSHGYSLVDILAYTSGASFAQKILQNNCLLNMFTFDVLSVCQSVTWIIVFKCQFGGIFSGAFNTEKKSNNILA